QPAHPPVDPPAEPERAVDQLLHPRPPPRRPALAHAGERPIRPRAAADRAQRIQGGPAGRRRLQSGIPVVGDDGTATSRRGIRPARYASRPAWTASFMARAIFTGSFASAIAVFIRIPSTPCSIV